MQSHIRIFHVWDCDHCGVIYDTEEDQESHVFEKHQFYCNHCHFHTNSESEFDDHMEKEPCDTCECTSKTRD